jgi:signal peptidase I
MSIGENSFQKQPSLQEEAVGAMTLELLKKGLTCKFEAFGTSMLPQLQGGDLVEVEGLKSEKLKIGDIVLLYRLNKSGKYLIHRVLNIKSHSDKVKVYTKGDLSI